MELKIQVTAPDEAPGDGVFVCEEFIDGGDGHVDFGEG